jgi:hypothetical protein
VPRVDGTVGSSPVACLNASRRSQFDGAWTYVHADNDESREISIRRSVKLDMHSLHGIPSPEKDPDLPLHHMNHGSD